MSDSDGGADGESSEGTINPVAPNPSEIVRDSGIEGEIGGERTENEETEAIPLPEWGEVVYWIDHDEEPAHAVAAPKVLRKYQIAYDREVDGHRTKKTLEWNKNISFRKEFKKKDEARTSISTSKIGVRVLEMIPTNAWGMFEYNVDDPSSDLIFAYSLELQYCEVQDIEILAYFQHLRVLDLSGNHMKMESLAVLEQLPKLMSLKVNDNRLRKIDIPAPPILELQIKYNRLIGVEPFKLPKLQNLVMDSNRLKKFANLNKEYSPELTHVSCAFNHLTTTMCDWTVSITHLFLSYNKIRHIEGLEHLVNLRGLFLRSNKIKKLSGFSPQMKNLRYLNIRENKITNIRQFRRLRDLPRLKIINCKSNPFDTVRPPETNRLAIVFCMRKLFTINKEDVTMEEIQQCKTARSLIDNDDESSDDNVPEDPDELDDHPPPKWEEDDEEWARLAEESAEAEVK